MIRVSAPSRLHFGLFTLPRAQEAAAWLDRDGSPTVPARHFGGVGLMVQQPGVVLAVEPATAWSAEGPLAERALTYARKVAETLGLDQAFRIVVESVPREHVGLGTGTQLAMAVGRAVVSAAGRAEIDPIALAQAAGRGLRSALGIHGFAHGGFLVEGGKRAATEIAPLVAHVAFPADWAVLLVIPHELHGDHGSRETAAFHRLAAVAPDLQRTDTLCRLVLFGMLPALAERDFAAFGECLYDFNRRVGEMFGPWQGGLYAHPRIAQLVAAIRGTGLAPGVGQSSWGPTVFAVVRSGAVHELSARLGREGVRDDELIRTAAASTGTVLAAA